MFDFAVLLILINFFVLLVGLVKPNLVVKKENASRKKVLKYYGLSFVGVWIFASFFAPTPKQGASTENLVEATSDVIKEVDLTEFDEYDMTLKGYLEESKFERKEISEELIEFYGNSDIPLEVIHACISVLSRQKSQDLLLGTIIGWCLQDYKNNPQSLAKYFDYDGFENQFSPWDGSHNNLEKLILANMNDSDSYDHVETKFRLVISDKEQYAIIYTKFRGKNAFGGTVLSSVNAKVDVRSGSILEIIE